MAIPAAAIAASVGLSVAGSLFGSSASKKAAKEAARLERINAAERERISRRESSALLARQRTIIAAQGTTVEGSPLLILEDTAAEAELEALNIRAGGDAAARSRISEGRAASQAALFDAGSTIIGGIGKILAL